MDRILGIQSIADGWAEGVSRDGETVVGSSNINPDTRQAFRWTQSGGLDSLGSLLPGKNSYGSAVSSDGSWIVGTAMNSYGYEAFLWNEATGIIGLGNPPGSEESAADAVSDDGSIVVGSFGYRTGAFVWTEASGIRSLLDVLNNEYGFRIR